MSEPNQAQEEQERLQALVRGRVQGVGFRYFVQREASALGLSGYVRNRWDGSVEVVAEGPHQPLERLLARLWVGPRSAYVQEIITTWGAASGEFRFFNVRF